jgi:hypothetical protein
MPCEIKVEVVQGIDFLQVVNITLYATTMNFSNNSSLKIITLTNILLFTFSRFTPTALLIWFIMVFSTLR